MRCCSYSLNGLKNANVCVKDKPLVVNCAGIVSVNRDFTNENLHGRNDFYLLYVIKGELEFCCEENKDRIKKGEFIIISPNTYYKYKNKSGEEIDYYWIHFSGSEAENVISEMNLELNRITHIDVQDNIVRSFHRVFDEFVQPDNLHDISCGALLVTLLTRFSRAVRGVEEGKNSGHLLYETLQYMNRHYNEPLTMPELAEHANLSYGYFRRLFHEIMGMSPSEYLVKLRMENACLLLYRTDISIKEVSYQVGFSDQLYFSRIFTKFYGMSPSKFRAEQKK